MAQIVATLFLNKTYADEDKTCEDMPPVCTATPDHMSIYLEFQNEMASLLSTNKFKQVKESVSEWKWWLFTSKILTISGAESFNESLAGKTLRIFDITATRSATSLLTSLFLFELAAIWALADNTIWLTILFQDRPIVRDWTKLLDVEWWLSETAYNLWVVWDIWRKIEDTKALNDIIQKYIWKGLFQEDAQFGGGVLYTEIILKLARLNSAVKRFVAYDSIGLLENYNKEFPDLKINTKFISELHDEYKCARWTFWFKCSTARSSLKKNLQILTNNTNNKWKSSVKQIKDSYTELKWALWNWTELTDRFKWKDSTLTETERELLKSRYWLDADKLTKAESSSLISLNSNIQSKWKNLAKWIKTAKEWFKWAITDFKKQLKETREAVKDMEKYLAESSYIGENLAIMFWFNTETWKKSDKKWSKIYEYLSGKIAEVNNSRLSIDQMINKSSNVVLSRWYIELLDQIEELITVIGDQDGGLRQSLKSLCSTQCWNKWSECCYVK